MGNNSSNIPLLLFMSIFVAVLLKSGSSNTTYTQGTDTSDSVNTSKQSAHSAESNSSDNFNMTTNLAGIETPHKGSDTTMNYSDTTDYNDYFDYGDEYIYPGYTFERPMYLYIWEILVISTFLVNIVVVSVLLHKKMRNATNLILAAIAISDTLTGLITLPTYIMVYKDYDPLPDSYYTYDGHNFGNITNNESSPLPSYPDATYMLSNQNLEISTSSFDNQNMSLMSSYPKFDGVTEIRNFDHYASTPHSDGYILTKNLCRGFMISKYFLSKSFHTMSIFLTLLLGIQRYLSVAFLHKSKSIFTVNKTIIFCVFIFLISPVLHVYHLASDKAVDGMCEWNLSEEGCGGDCIYLWALFSIRHFIPCVSLTTFTVLFIKHLRFNASQPSKRKKENRRISIIVTAILIVFLVPEIPYGIFLLYSAFEKTVNEGKNFHLKTNRAIHMAYEILLALSFNANFYIYLFLNKKFRICFYKIYINPVQRLVWGTRRFSVFRASTTSTSATRKTDCGTSQGASELKAMPTSSTDRSVTMETKLNQSLSQET